VCHVLQWLKLSADDVKDQIYKLAKKGLTPSQIGELAVQMSFVGILEQLNCFKKDSSNKL